MRKHNFISNHFQIIGALVMINVLLWFTMSTPVIYDFQLKEKAVDIALSEPGESDEENDFSHYPINNNPEEKTESNQTSSSEYLHDPQEMESQSDQFLTQKKSRSDAEYIAYHGELLSPPPKA
jgi:hypothetical protein